MDSVEHGDFILAIHMSIGLSYLLQRVANQIRYDGWIGSMMDEHRDERVTQVVKSNCFDFGFFAIRLEPLSYSVWGQGAGTAEEEGGLALVCLQLLGDRFIDRCYTFLFRFCGCYLVW